MSLFDHLVVPVDRTPASMRAVSLAARIAARVGGRVLVLTVVDSADEARRAGTELAFRVSQLGPLPVAIERCVLVGDSAARVVATELRRSPGALVVMAAHGRGRSAAVIGSTLAELLDAIDGPIVVLGPEAADDLRSGEIFVPLDGSEDAEAVLALTRSWAAELGSMPTLVEVVTTTYADSDASAYLRSQADALAELIGRPVDHEVLHGGDVGLTVAENADAAGASLIVAATHGRTGLARLASGSVAAGIVRHARMPVVLVRPAHEAARSGAA